jgi:thiamine pyrophosphokinase
MRAVVIANGRKELSPLLRQVVRAADLLVCADGGTRLARAIGRPPHAVVGDLDSGDARSLAWARQRGAAIVRHPPEKDKTDTELAIDYALDAGAGDVDLVAALGRRMDHTLANVALLMRVQRRGGRGRILDGRTELFLASAQTLLHGQVGDLVSLIPLTEDAHGVRTQGLAYPLNGATLHADTTRGISNVMTSLPVSVGVERGWLLIVVTHKSESRRK